MKPVRMVYSVAPIRICDCGGWTDTWFARYGRVFNVGMSPFVEVQVAVSERGQASDAPLVVTAENYGTAFVPSSARLHHPLLEAAIERMGVPADHDYHVTLFSEMPPGASTGTSAAVTVALIGALDRLTPGRMTAHEIAETAFRIETEMLGRQSGIQDQMCAAYGGILQVEIFDYPQTRVHRLEAPDDVWWELEHRLLLIYLGKTHDSSAIHQMVIRDLENTGPEHPTIQTLRQCADDARNAVMDGDFPALGLAMVRNTEAQRALHPHLVSEDADRIALVAKEFGVEGWKVNGAGGDGGSVTLLCGPDMPRKRELIRTLEGLGHGYRNIPVRISRLGTRIWVRDQSPMVS